MNETKGYKVIIFDDPYSLISDESQEKISQSANLVDSLMREIDNKLSTKDPKKIAVLAALHIANKVLKVEEELKRYISRESELVTILERSLSLKQVES